MSYSVRHQVFVSSTFTDLAAERAEVIQAIWELDCIPTGMEAFVASNEGQWDVIKRVIDECDYYVLIIGGRYGSTTSEGISYTEKEYRYAKKIGLPVLAFVHGEPESIPVGKAEKDEASRQKLESFRSEVMSTHPIRNWKTPSELGGLVSRSLVREIKISPRPGWIRNDGSSPIALLERINTLTEENRRLQDQLDAQEAEEDDDSLESGDDKVTVYGIRRETDDGWNIFDVEWNVEVSWNDLFRDIGPALINETTEDKLTNLIARFHSLQPTKNSVRSATVAVECWSEILVQFRALGLMVQGTKKRGVNDRGSYWGITPKGDRLLIKLLARRKATPSTAT
ncbi:DUF4062 domain-containing protein [Thioclava sp. 'Guangxiensis']|uniref:DUF4062 domain-containing protein n=1 Tax=Thioclava sp. 'Guangxiensis' TaxID=3149044 RepID=UPI00387814B6